MVAISTQLSKVLPGRSESYEDLSQSRSRNHCCYGLGSCGSSAVAFPLGSGTFGTSIFGDSDGDLVQDALDAFPLDGRGHSDADLDGLPDEWENANGLNSSNPNDAEFDADRDGFTNAEEFKSATDPSVSNGKSQIVVITAPVAMARGSTASVSLSYTLLTPIQSLGLGHSCALK